MLYDHVKLLCQPHTEWRNAPFESKFTTVERSIDHSFSKSSNNRFKWIWLSLELALGLLPKIIFILIMSVFIEGLLTKRCKVDYIFWIISIFYIKLQKGMEFVELVIWWWREAFEETSSGIPQTVDLWIVVQTLYRHAVRFTL